MNRRNFIKRSAAGTLLVTTGTFPLQALGTPDVTQVTILHTNDVHSRIEPFPMDGGRFQGLGGAARRASLIQKIRKESSNVLLVDCGDIFQGTPYFNFFGGELEFKLMTEMEYDVATIGNHDFDAGIDGLHKQLPNAGFSLVNCNYDFSDTIMNGFIEPYQIFQKGDVKIGVLGVGIELTGLVPENLYKNTRYLDPIENANRVAKQLKQELECDLVICLSHLGYKYDSDKVSDEVLAKNSEHIDIILGGHTHTFMEQAEQRKNKAGELVLIHQVGWAGILLGRIDLYFERNFKKKCTTCQNLVIK